jgi:uncharacterized protein YkwD
MLIETNMVRKKYNIYPLVLNNNLNNAAQEHANYMDSTMILSHK